MTIENINSLREHIRAFIHLDDRKVSTHLSILETEECDGYTRQRVEYNAPDGDRIPAFMLLPDRDEPYPGIVVFHQHNSQWQIGKSEVVGLTESTYQAFGPEFAQQGICILAPDAIGFEERYCAPGVGAKLAPPVEKEGYSVDGWLQYYNQMCHRLVSGDLLLRKVMADALSAVTVLNEHPGVDSSRIGALGHSFGGIVALFLSALDTRVCFSCSSGAVCSYEHKLRHGVGLDMSLVVPGIVQHFDLHDLVSCVAPRRMLIVSSDEDPMTADAAEVVAKASSTFKALKCKDHLTHLHTTGKHELDLARFQAIVKWMTEAAQRRVVK